MAMAWMGSGDVDECVDDLEGGRVEVEAGEKKAWWYGERSVVELRSGSMKLHEEVLIPSTD